MNYEKVLNWKNDNPDKARVLLIGPLILFSILAVESYFDDGLNWRFFAGTGLAVIGFAQVFLMSSKSSMSPEDINELTAKASKNNEIKKAIANKQEVKAIKVIVDEYSASLADAKTVADSLRDEKKQPK